MQEEVNEKTISLCIKGGKITAKILKAALIKLLAEMDKKKKQQEKGKGQCKRTGKQSIKSLQRSGAQITNIVVTDNNIKSFDRVARKYSSSELPECLQRKACAQRYSDDGPKAAGRKTAKHICRTLVWCWRCDRMG